jgi:Tfp pilus assembly protein PilV
MNGNAQRSVAGSAGFGSIEAMVAIALLAAICAGFASTVSHARRLHTAAAIERKATHLAVAALERLRAGGSPAADEVAGFTVTTSVAPWADAGRLSEARVEVRWGEGEQRSMVLRTLLLR